MNWLSWEQICSIFPKRKRDSHKGTFGTLLCITGSDNMPGACALSTLAALRSGAGLVKVATTRNNVSILASQIYEAIYLPMQTDDIGGIIWEFNQDTLCTAIAQASAILLGCGLGDTAATQQLVREIVRLANCPIVIDADGLNALAACIDIMQEQKENWILTPHPGEMARLIHSSSSVVQADRSACALHFCETFSGTLVLKGAGTIVQQGTTKMQNPTGNPGMSRGGSGDVLAGMIASFAAQGISPYQAACAGVYLHGLAGDLAAEQYSEQAMLPRDVLQCLPQVFHRMEQSAARQ
ncbi:MAG: NAD(P)H-hydrate dehydratase [Oscillospiraceae bacterium]|nr:NAD(P)H-hydrate dehydratase [Oscillospiraceae bacterium]